MILLFREKNSARNCGAFNCGAPREKNVINLKTESIRESTREALENSLYMGGVLESS